jgi:ribosomal protein S18 acetylase RimI-like enzyme
MIKTVNQKELTVAREILEVQRAAYLQESLLIDYPNLPPLKETLADIKGSDEIFLVHFTEDTVTGVLSYSVKEKSLKIQRLIVHPTFARQGIGQALLKEILQLPGIKHFIVSTAAKNTPALHLYEKNGFAIIDRHTLPDGLDLVTLEKH